jgi:type IX secretion system PorP/SprF family membrane protein
MKFFSTSLLFFLVIFGIQHRGYAQDPQFSQGSFATPLYLNPAFTGSTSEWRASALYRTQWTGVRNDNFKSLLASVDHNISSHHNGIGMRVMHDRAGDYITNMITGLYAHHISFKSSILSFGLGVSYVSKSLDPNTYIFRDQLAIDKGSLGQTNETFGAVSRNMASFSGGILFKAANKFWFGAAVDHINSPAKDAINGVPLLPMKFTIHGGLNLLSLNKHGDASAVSGYPSFVFRKQGPFTQLDLGVNISKDAHKDGWGYVLGGWYRGMLMQSSVSEASRHDAIVALAGITLGDMTFTYSYDIVVSKFAPYGGSTSEISVIFENNLNKTDSRKGGIANPIYLERFPIKGKRR